MLCLYMLILTISRHFCYVRRVLPFTIPFLLWVGGVVTAHTAEAGTYDVKNLMVRAKAEDGVVAREKALRETYQKSWNVVLKRLLPMRHHNQLPQLSVSKVEAMVRGVVVGEERFFVNHGESYCVLRLDVYFDGRKVRSFLRKAGFPFKDLQAAPVVIVPIYKEEGEISSWTGNLVARAWEALDLKNSLTPIQLFPYGTELSPSEMETLLKGDPENVPTLLRYYEDRAIFANFCEVDPRNVVRCFLKSSNGVEIRVDVPVSDDGMPSDAIQLALHHAVATFLTRLEERWRNPKM